MTMVMVPEELYEIGTRFKSPRGSFEVVGTTSNKDWIKVKNILTGAYFRYNPWEDGFACELHRIEEKA